MVSFSSSDNVLFLSSHIRNLNGLKSLPSASDGSTSQERVLLSAVSLSVQARRFLVSLDAT